MRYCGRWANKAPAWVQHYMAFLVVSTERCLMLSLLFILSARVKRADGLFWSVFPFRALWIIGLSLLELALAVAVQSLLHRTGRPHPARSLFGGRPTAHGAQMDVQAVCTHARQPSAVVPASELEARASATGVRAATIVPHHSADLL